MFKTQRCFVRAVLLAAIIGAAIVSCNWYKQDGHADVRRGITKGIDFLYKDQLPYGEFKTYVSSDRDFQAPTYFDSSPFVTALVLYSISFSGDYRVKVMTQKAVPFFLEEMEGHGEWGYWTKRNKHRIGTNLAPDLDDTACISFFLKKYKVPFPSNTNIILGSRNQEGLFYTWINRVSINPIDTVVNANVLCYLGENKDTKNAVDFLNLRILNHQEASAYYPDIVSVYYAISKAYDSGVKSLSLSRGLIIHRIISMQKKDGSFGNELSTALALCTLLNFGYQAENVDKAVMYLLSKQARDGSWARDVFFVGMTSYFASQDMTTAICVEALSKYLGVHRKGARSDVRAAQI